MNRAHPRMNPVCVSMRKHMTSHDWQEKVKMTVMRNDAEEPAPTIEYKMYVKGSPFITHLVITLIWI